MFNLDWNSAFVWGCIRCCLGEGDKTRLIKREGGREGPSERKAKENTCSMRCCIQSKHLEGGRLIKRRGSKKVHAEPEQQVSEWTLRAACQSHNGLTSSGHLFIHTKSTFETSEHNFSGETDQKLFLSFKIVGELHMFLYFFKTKERLLEFAFLICQI